MNIKAQPLRTPSARTLAAAFLALSFVLSVATLAARNLYDDEIASLPVVAGTVRSIITFAATVDVHPPGMYLLAHVAWLAIPSYRWMDLFPCAALYAGLAVFLFAFVPLLHRTRSRILFLLLATLHPELLLWSNTFRWYSWWTALALIALTAALQPRTEQPILRWPRSAALGFTLAALFYLNYITLLFAVAMALVMLLRYRMQAPRALVARAAVIAAIFAILSTPQLRIMITSHLSYTAGQRAHLPASTVRLSEALAASEAYLPWAPLAVLACLCFSILSIIGIVQLARSAATRDIWTGHDAALRALMLFGFVFFTLVALSGLGGKPRSAILLVPVLAPVAAIIAGRFRPWTQNALLGFLALWSAVGIVHMLGRYGIAKAIMNDRPEQVVEFVRQEAAGSCAIVATYDTGLVFALAQAHLSNVAVLSAAGGDSPAPPHSHPMGNCSLARLYLVQSYLGSDDQRAQTVRAEQADAARRIEGRPQVHSFSPDPEAARKRRLARLRFIGRDLQGAGQLPDYRFVVTSGAMNPRQLASVEQQLPDYIPQQ